MASYTMLEKYTSHSKDFSWTLVIFVCLSSGCQGAVRLYPEENPLWLSQHSMLNLTCQSLDGQPVVWYKDGVTMDITSETGFITVQETITSGSSSVTISSLWKHDVTEEDAGLYTCRADKESSIDKRVKVMQGTLQFYPDENPLWILQGSKLNLTCQSRNGRSVVWHKDSTVVEIPSDEGFKTGEETTYTSSSVITRSSLWKDNVGQDDAGTYTCRTESDSTPDIKVNVVRVQSESVSVRPGEQAVMRCVPDAIWQKDIKKLQWTKDKHALPRDREEKIGQNYSNFSMVLKETVPSDSGQYACVLTFDTTKHDGSLIETSLIQTLELDVQVASTKTPLPAPSPALDALTVSPTAGLSVLAPGSFEIECNSTVVSEFEWFKNGTPIANGGGVQIEKTSDRGSKLTILHSLSSHTAIYKCYNKQEPAHEFSVFVLKVTAHDQNLTATEMTIIQCLPEDLIDADMNVVTPSLVWLKNGAQFNADLEKRVTRHNDNFSLEIRKTKHADAARYDCVFEIQGTNLSQTVNLWDAPYIERKEKSKNMVEGDNLILQCRVSGHPKPVITWRRQLDNNENDAIEDIDKLFSDTSRIGTKPLDMENGVILDNGKLEIFSLEFDDRANYICSAENEWGTNNSTTLVRVKDKLAALWPFLAIVAEVIILCAIIFLYEKKRAKETDSDDDVAQQKSLNAQDHKSKDEVRQRK